jgi:3(or 17)beta-hydroxysteroid dehydrogenase
MMNRVLNKVAIVTGGGSGIGRATSKLLAREGAKVVITDLNEVNGKAVMQEIVSDGGEAICMKHDVSSEPGWQEVIQKTLEECRKLDILVNNAGIFLNKSIVDTSLEEWRRIMAVNLEGVFLGSKYAIPAMKANGGGSIINISSTGGLVGMNDSSAYNASKGGVRLFTKAAAVECSEAGHGYNIRVNSVHPAITKTAMMQNVFQDEVALQKMLGGLALKRYAEPEDIAYGVLYLASDESRFMTGTELIIDGGRTAQ